MEVRPVYETSAFRMTRSPRRIGWRKTIESIATVTTFRWAWRIQASAPASSTSFMIQPPWTLPSRLACSGCISWESVTREALTGLGARSSVMDINTCQEFTMSGILVGAAVQLLPQPMLIQIFAQLAAVHGVQALGLFNKDIN